MSLTFTKTPDIGNPYDHSTVVVSTETLTLGGILEAVTDFLRASGFSFKGDLDVVDSITGEGLLEESRKDARIRGLVRALESIEGIEATGGRFTWEDLLVRARVEAGEALAADQVAALEGGS